MKNKNCLRYLLFTFIVVCTFTSCIKNDRYIAPVIPVHDPCSAQPGPLFIEVKNLLSKNCVGCHNNSQSQGSMNFAVDCNIVTFKARIKARAVDQGTMPPRGPLSQADKDKITAWMNAGGNLSN